MYAKIQKLLDERNMSQYQLAKETGIAQSSLSDWKLGKSKPKTDKLQILANYFNVPIEYFLEEQEANHASN